MRRGGRSKFIWLTVGSVILQIAASATVPEHFLLLHGDGNFDDRSVYAHEMIHENVGFDAGTAKFGSHSMRFDGSSSQLCFAAFPQDLGLQPVTIDFWLKLNVAPAERNQDMTIFELTDESNSLRLVLDADNELVLNIEDLDRVIEYKVAYPAEDGLWHHVAMELVDEFLGWSEAVIYVDGIAVKNCPINYCCVSNAAISIAASADGTDVLNGWIDEFSFRQRLAWREDFEPPASAYEEPPDEVESATLMQDAYVRPNQAITIWGVINKGEHVRHSGFTYEWTLEHGPAVETVISTDILTGEVADPQNIALDVVFNLLEGTRSRVRAVLTVTGSSAQVNAETAITIISNADHASDTPLEALEMDRQIAARKALRFLYLRQGNDGSWGNNGQFWVGDAAVAATATALWAFANFGHTPDKDPALDLYQPTVLRGLEYLFAESKYVPTRTISGRNPDINGNGRALSLGSWPYGLDEGYVRGMALAALCAGGAPEKRTYVEPFNNDGAGTSYREIVHDAAEYLLLELAQNAGGGWGYSFQSGTRPDNSIASWNYIGLEAALMHGVELPQWAHERPEMLLAATWDGNGDFGYDNAIPISMACSGSGLTGLTYITLNGRYSGLDDGMMLVRNLKRLSERSGESQLRTDPYQMWTVARALRLADVESLVHDGVPYDWQRNTTSAGAANEGFWPFLCRTQRPNGSWLDNPDTRPETIYNTAFYTLCLSTGVIGAESAIERITVQSRITEDDSVELLTAVAEIPPQVTNNSDSEIILEWPVQSLAAGQSIDLSYDQYLHNLAPHDARQVQKSVSITYSSDLAEETKHSLGPLNVAIADNIYAAEVQVAPKMSQPGATVTVNAYLQLPPGQKWQMITEPGPGRHILTANAGGRGAEWTSLRFDILNEEAFPAGILPVSVQVRSASAPTALSRRTFSPPLSLNPCPLSYLPGNLLELDLQFQENGIGVLPQVRNLTVFYNSASARAVLQVLDAHGKVIGHLWNFAMTAGDYGASRTYNCQWTIPQKLQGELHARLIIFEDDQLIIQAVDSFEAQIAELAEVTHSVRTLRRYFSCNDNVQIRSTVENAGAQVEALNISVDIWNDQNESVLGMPFRYDLSEFEPGERDVRSFVWNTALHEPGTYCIRQILSGNGIEQLEQVQIEIEPGFLYSDGLAGEVNAEPAVVEFPQSFDIQWQLRNNSNAPWENVMVQVRMVDLADPLHDVRGERILTTGQLLQNDVLDGRWNQVSAETELPMGNYLILLQARSAGTRTEAQTVAVSQVRIEDTIPPVTAHDYAQHNEWVATAPTIHFSAQDAGSGVAKTSYTSTGVTVTGNVVTITEEGETDVWFRSEDMAGNIEDDQLLIVKVDQTPPLLIHNYDPDISWWSTPVTVDVSASDNHSGLRELCAVLDGATVLNSAGTVRIDHDGVHELYLYAADAAGNEAADQLEIRLDTAPPLIAHDFHNAGEWQHEPVILQFDVDDALSGVASVHFSLNDQSLSVANNQVIIDSNGRHLVQVQAVDFAGNTAEENVEVLMSLTGPAITHDFQYDGEWIKQQAVIHFEAVSQYHQVEKMWYTLNEGSQVENTVVEIAEPGIHTLTLAASDTAQATTTVTLTVKIDKQPPHTEVRPDVAPDIWLNELPTLTLHAADDPNGSGVAETYYELGNAGMPQVGNQIALSGDGIHALSYWSTDVAGNQEEKQQLSLMIDTTAPQIKHDFTRERQWLNQPVRITFNAEDSLSGVKETAWVLNAEQPVTDKRQLTLEQSGKHSLKLQALDEAGNRNSLTLDIWIDRQPPTVSHNFTDETKTVSKAVITITADDAHSGIASTWYRLDGKAKMQAQKVTVTQPGDHKLVLGATDNAGNEATVSVHLSIAGGMRPIGNLSDLRDAMSQLGPGPDSSGKATPVPHQGSTWNLSRTGAGAVLSEPPDDRRPHAAKPPTVTATGTATRTKPSIRDPKAAGMHSPDTEPFMAPVRRYAPPKKPPLPASSSFGNSAAEMAPVQDTTASAPAATALSEPVVLPIMVQPESRKTLLPYLRRWALPALSALLLLGLVSVSNQDSILVLYDRQGQRQIFHEPGRETLLWQLRQVTEQDNGLRKFCLLATGSGHRIWLQRSRNAEILLQIKPAQVILRTTTAESQSEVDITALLSQALDADAELQFCITGGRMAPQVQDWLRKMFPGMHILITRRKRLLQCLNRTHPRKES